MPILQWLQKVKGELADQTWAEIRSLLRRKLPGVAGSSDETMQSIIGVANGQTFWWEADTPEAIVCEAGDVVMIDGKLMESTGSEWEEVKNG